MEIQRSVSWCVLFVSLASIIREYSSTSLLLKHSFVFFPLVSSCISWPFDQAWASTVGRDRQEHSIFLVLSRNVAWGVTALPGRICRLVSAAVWDPFPIGLSIIMLRRAHCYGVRFLDMLLATRGVADPWRVRRRRKSLHVAECQPCSRNPKPWIWLGSAFSLHLPWLESCS